MADAMTKEQQDLQQTKEAVQQGVQRAKEGEPTRAISELQEQAPSMIYAYLAAGSILGSLLLFLFKKRDAGIFVGLWPPTFLGIGLFYKLIRPSREMRSQF